MKVITQYKKINETNLLCMSIHYCPFDPIHGLKISKEEMVKNGYILVDTIPSPELKIGMNAQLHFNPEQRVFWYEYEEVPKTQEELQEQLQQKKIQELESALLEMSTIQAIKGIENEQAIMELTTMVSTMIGGM